MFFVYILKSSQDGELYIGSTNDLKKRLKEHNAGVVESTRNRAPFRLVYYEAYASEAEARHREQNLKLRGRARLQLFRRINQSLAS